VGALERANNTDADYLFHAGAPPPSPFPSSYLSPSLSLSLSLSLPLALAAKERGREKKKERAAATEPLERANNTDADNLFHAGSAPPLIYEYR